MFDAHMPAFGDCAVNRVIGGIEWSGKDGIGTVPCSINKNVIRTQASRMLGAGHGLEDLQETIVQVLDDDSIVCAFRDGLSRQLVQLPVPRYKRRLKSQPGSHILCCNWT